MRLVLVFLSGLLFGLGVSISGMVDPLKVQNFMDITGTFDPTLLSVMAAALAVTLIGYRIVLRRQAPLYDDRFHLPVQKAIDARLLLGATLFGVGWGLSGFCPGPAAASLVFGNLASLIFLAGLAAGMIATRVITSRSA